MAAPESRKIGAGSTQRHGIKISYAPTTANFRNHKQMSFGPLWCVVA
jgi:hypothetical protein